MSTRNIDIVKKMQYVMNMRPVLNTQAFFSDGTGNYRRPACPKTGEEVTIRFRTQKKNVDAVYLVYGDQRREMDVAESWHGFDYYETTIVMGEEILRYHFEILFGWNTYYYNSMGTASNAEGRMDFEIYPNYDTPEWAFGTVMYQIFVDRFCNGDPSNDVLTGEYFYIGDVSRKVEDWYKTPDVMGVREFYGGDLQGVWNQLDYLQDLGIETIYLNPIFVSPSNHKYDCQDYEYVDPHFGKIVKDEGSLLAPGDQENAHAQRYINRVTSYENLEASNQLFADLVAEIHRRGMRVILDGVFNHCGSFNKWMDRERIYEHQEGYPKGAYISEQSPYRSYFHFEDQNAWPYNPTYDGWWGHDTLPKLNYEASEELYHHILEIGKKWVSPPYNIDGWRLDVAADLGHSLEYNHQFWKDFRKAVREANPEAIVLAEHYGNPEGWLQGDEWDTVMNYDAFMEPLSWFLTGMEKHSDEYREELYGNSEAFIYAMKVHMKALHMAALGTAMNELSNHDHSRFLTRTNRMVGRLAYRGAQAASEGIERAVLREAVVVQMTWPGAPTVYYGDEAGVCGFTDPDNRRTYPWGREDYQMIDFHKTMIRIHKKYPVLIHGSLEFLWNDFQGLAYGRFDQKEQILVVLNNQKEERDVTLDVWRIGLDRRHPVVMKQILVSDENQFTEAREEHEVKEGILKLHLPSLGAVVLYHKEDENQK